jgi:hypothetical protein
MAIDVAPKFGIRCWFDQNSIFVRGGVFLRTSFWFVPHRNSTFRCDKPLYSIRDVLTLGLGPRIKIVLYNLHSMPLML